MTTTRLDKLLALLETGTSSTIREVSARQIGELTKYHRDELNAVLKKVSVYLKKPKWETRVAAGLAVASIAESYPAYIAQKIPENISETQINEEMQRMQSTLFSFETFDFNNVIQFGTPLLASGEDEESQIQSRLGLNTNEVKEEEIINPESTSKMSARQLNRMKRKAKKQQTTQPKKKIKLETQQLQTYQVRRWEFYNITDEYKQDLFNPNWHARHGAAIGLREILKIHATSAGKTDHVKNERERKIQNEKWLEDMCIRVLCILALDRFGDFISDQVVAPVRETCAQILGVVIKFLNKDIVLKIIHSLLQLMNHQQWEIRHGGLLGLKYAIAVRQDVVDVILPLVLPLILNTLETGLDDDVRAVAADTLVPIVEHVVKCPPDSLKQIRDILWNTLLDLDDLSASTASVMKLLSKFYSLAGPNDKIFFSQELSELIPRLWPFLRHNLVSVRQSAIQTLQKLIEKNAHLWIYSLLPDTIRYVFQNIILETKQELVDASLVIWQTLMEHVQRETLSQVANHLVGYFINILSTPFGNPLDINLFLFPSAVRRALQEGHIQQKERTFAIRLKITDTEEYIQMRISGAKALSILARYCDNFNNYYSGIEALVDSRWASHKQMGGILIEETFQHISLPKPLLEKVVNIILMKYYSYIELEQMERNVYNELLVLKNYYNSLNVSTNEITNLFESHDELYNQVYSQLSNQMEDKSTLDLVRNKTNQIIMQYKNIFNSVHTLVLTSLSSALVLSNAIAPEYLDILIYSLMESLKTQTSLILQERTSISLARLVFLNENAHSVVDVCCDILCNTMNCQEGTGAFYFQRGAKFFFKYLALQFGEKLFTTLTSLYKRIASLKSEPSNVKEYNSNLYILKTLAPYLDKSLYPELEEILKCLIPNIVNQELIVQLASTISSICNVITPQSMKIIIHHLLPTLADVKNTLSRRGAVYCLDRIVVELEMKILPYIVFFIVPLLKRMSDQDEETRTTASKCFGMLVKILPLEKAIPEVPGFEQARESERKFLEQLLDSKKIENYEIPVPIEAQLRKYQQEGVNWLAFLNKFNLHGILCDDMGLGKTLQTICIIAGDQHTRKEKYLQTSQPEFAPLPNLIVCPPTLVGHWYHEILKFTKTLKPIQYSGTVHQRKNIRKQFNDYDVVIMSYDILRNDIQEIKDYQFNYCVLDEGHIIRNAKTKITKAVKMIIANHRLILSGTPIQNNVLELWSLFDFLMPGFLGTEKEFKKKYSAPILASKDAKKNSKEQEAGTLAMEALHRQVLPFLLRRMKENVLDDLPEKIIQDVYCELSDIQAKLYEDFSKSKLQGEIVNQIQQAIGEKKQNHHVFQALQYIRKLCNHPCLVLNENHPKYNEVMNDLQKSGKDLHDITLSPKLMTLQQLIKDAIEGQHRILVFAQMKSMLDIIENDLFKKEMQNVTYLRLDGSVDANQRHALVTKFNSDPTIDVLLLTTRVGGLGLNLTGADTVIFVEHDWNPSADLQAMDRAHRIGQKRVVNVYRLITKNTIEEKIMNLQQFKLHISKSVVNRENESFKTMETEQLMDLFKLSESEQPQKKKSTSALSNLEELWDETQYDEYDLNSFLKKLE